MPANAYFEGKGHRLRYPHYPSTPHLSHFPSRSVIAFRAFSNAGASNFDASKEAGAPTDYLIIDAYVKLRRSY